MKPANKKFKSNFPTLQTFFSTLLDKLQILRFSKLADFHETRYQQIITTLLYHVFHNATILLQFSQRIFERCWCSWRRIHKTSSHFVWGRWVMITIPAYLT